MFALVLMAGASWLLSDGGGTPRGTAFEDDGGVQGAAGPVLRGEPLTFGLIQTRNQSSEPVELVRARPLRLDPDLELLGFTARPAQGAPATAREQPVDLAVPLADFPVLEPGRQVEVAMLFALKVRPGAKGGSAVGTEVTYSEGGQLRRQVFKTEAHICEAATLQSDCADRLHDDFGDYDEEVRKRVEASLASLSATWGTAAPRPPASHDRLVACAWSGRPLQPAMRARSVRSQRHDRAHIPPAGDAGAIQPLHAARSRPHPWCVA